MTIVFMGSDPISYGFLRALLSAEDISVRAIVTQPDRRQGKKMQESAFRTLLRENSIDIEQFLPININKPDHPEIPIGPDNPDPIRQLADYNADVFVVVAYGQYLGKRVRSLPRHGCLNMHLSLLPELRGAAPIQRAILSGAPQTGVTAMQISKGIDAGDMYGQVALDILPTDNHETLSERLIEAGIPLMLQTLRALANGTAVATPQDASRATEAAKILADEWLLDWSEPAEVLERRIRAFAPRPGCTGYLPPLNGYPPPEAFSNPALLRKYWGPVLKVLAAEILPELAPMEARPGEIVAIDKKGIVVATGDHHAMRLTSVRPDGKPRPLDGPSFVNGYRSKLHVGDRLDPDPRNALSQDDCPC